MSDVRTIGLCHETTDTTSISEKYTQKEDEQGNKNILDIKLSYFLLLGSFLHSAVA